MNVNEILAGNLRRLRTERNLSLGGLAELSGVSKVMLSQIEKGESSPTINTLWKIANGLQVSYTKLIDEHIETPLITRRNESTLVDNQMGYLVYHYPMTNPARDFEFFESVLLAGCEFASEGHGINTHEYVLVTKGEMVVLYGNEEYLLAEGDFIHFDCSLPHTYCNRGEADVVFTNIVYYLG